MNSDPTPIYDPASIPKQETVETHVFSDIAGEQAAPAFEMPLSDITRATIEQGRAIKRTAPSTPFQD